MSEIIAAIDIETTGLDPLYHDIIEIAILPLDGGQVFLRLCHNWLGVRKGEKLCAAVGGSLTAALLLGGLWFALIRHASAPLAAGIWLLLAENDGGALVKNGEVL